MNGNITALADNGKTSLSLDVLPLATHVSAARVLLKAQLVSVETRNHTKELLEGSSRRVENIRGWQLCLTHQTPRSR